MSELHWNFFVPGGEHASLLLLGVGAGETAFRLAEHSGRVEALCFSEKQLQGVAKRAGAVGLEELQFQLHRPGARFDLEDGTVDGVIVERLVNYPVAYMDRTDPEQALRCLLEECRRVLADDGVLVAGAENLLHHALGLGAIVRGLRKSTSRTDEALEKDLEALGGNRRTFRRTLNGYLQLFHSAGFGRVRVLAPLPDGVTPRTVVSLDDPGPQRFLFRRRVRRHSAKTRTASVLGEFAAVTGLLPRVVPFYYLVASR